MVRSAAAIGDIRGTATPAIHGPPADAALARRAAHSEPLGLGTSARWRETTDGGTTWHDFASDYRQVAPVGPDMVFADASVGYAIFRGQIQRTTDGGAHWSAVKTPGT